MQSNMIHRFSTVPEVNVNRSEFNRSFNYKTTMDAGYLVPFYNDIMYPGDTFIGNCTVFGRLATPIYPFMDNVFIDTFFFSVPMRLVWEHFQNFMGEVNLTGPITTYEIPQRTVTTAYEPNTLEDYFALPTKITGYKHSILPLRAYALTWNEWFRSDHLQEPVPVSFGDVVEDTETYTLLRRGKRFDYFTSCLPFPQAGPGVNISLTGNAPIKYASPSTSYGDLFPTASGYPIGNAIATQPGTPGHVVSSGVSSAAATALWNYADLSSISAVTINTLREAFAMQHFLERLAVGGNRYTEIVRSIFGVESPDARLQRPEFLGHGSTRLNVNPVEQTAQTNPTSPQGNLAAYGVFRGDHHAFSYSATEHCIILGLINIRADLTYQQTLWKQWTYSTREEFYFPQFAHLGEQAVLNREIYCTGTDSDDEVFGYQERFAECRYYPSNITGLLKSNTNSGLDAWHLSQDFDSVPSLSPSFIEDNPPIDRVIAVPSEPQFLVDIFMDLRCIRPMPVYATPGLTRM